MFSRLTSHLRQNGVAYIALFFALSGGAVAANNYIRSTDTIPEGDLAGSTYGNPLIGSGKVTNGKLANSSLTVNSSTGLTGGGSVSLGGNTTLGVADGGIGTAQLAGGSVTTSKFDTNAQAPDSSKLGGKNPDEYGAVMSGRVRGLTTSGFDFGAASGTSTASATQADVTTLSPDHDLVLRDLSVQLTAAPGAGQVRVFELRIVGDSGVLCIVHQNETGCTSTGQYVSVPANSRLAFEDGAGSTGAPAADALFGFRLTEQ